MARITLQERWNLLMVEIEKLQQKHFNEISIPKYDKIYTVTRLGEINEKTITSYYIRYKDENDKIVLEPKYSKKPTKNDLENLHKYISGIRYDFKKYIIISYEEKHSFGILKGADQYDKIIESKDMSFNKVELEQIAKENKELYGPKEGYSPCTYCGKQIKNELLISSKIIGRDRKEIWNSWKKRYESKAFITENYLKFCSNECAGYEQMSREG